MPGVHGPRRPHHIQSAPYLTSSASAEHLSRLQRIDEEGRRGSDNPLLRRNPHLREDRRGSDGLVGRGSRYEERHPPRSRDYRPSNHPHELDLASPHRNRKLIDSLPVNDRGYGSNPRLSKNNAPHKNRQRGDKQSGDSSDSNATSSTLTNSTLNSKETGYSSDLVYSSTSDDVDKPAVKRGIMREKSDSTDKSDATDKSPTHSVTITEPEDKKKTTDLSLALRQQRSRPCSGCTFFKYLCVAVFIAVLGLIAFGIYVAGRWSKKYAVVYISRYIFTNHAT